MKNKLSYAVVFFFIVLMILYSCKHKKKNDFFPVISYIRSQIKNVDTSLLYSIMKIVTVDSTSDTTYVKREEFGNLAHDFSETPDLTEYSIGKNYKEDKLYDQSLNRVILTYTPLKKNAEVLRQEVVIIPGSTGDDKVKDFIIDRIQNKKDSTIHKRLLWQVDESFQVVDIIEKDSIAVSTKTTKVIWNKQEE